MGWVCDQPFKIDPIIKAQVNKQPLISNGCNMANQPFQITRKNKCMLARNDTSSNVMKQGPSTMTLSWFFWTNLLHNGNDI